MDAEQFETWKNSPATQWVMVRLAKIATEHEADTKERLFMSGGLSVAEWQAVQSPTAYERGFVQALQFVVGLDLENVSDGEN